MTTHSTHMQVVAQLKKAMQLAYRQNREADAEAIKEELNRIERKRTA